MAGTKFSGSNLVLTNRQAVHRQQDTVTGDLLEQGNLCRNDKGNVQPDHPGGGKPMICTETDQIVVLMKTL
ncbi:hypothetical protein CLV98_105225 [Dyadobacter jejuensis]|uniref:Uncharacterized protein n=1 Tax=Dyadobacter jejuensis TaxID=1082580 RepID=A0A316ALV3_9BACT|nr:hypothetical protein CLV98_105225 [Dyadobacter jejuensis]